MPVVDTVTEWLYYWGFGAWIAHSAICVEASAPAGWTDAATAGVGLWVAAEAGNCWCHIHLAGLRPRTSVPAQKDSLSLPVAGPFALVSFPHYLFEILSWVAFNAVLLAQEEPPLNLGRCSGVVFCAVGACIMGGWAAEKHAALREHFGGRFPAHRRRLIPFVF